MGGLDSALERPRVGTIVFARSQRTGAVPPGPGPGNRRLSLNPAAFTLLHKSSDIYMNTPTRNP